MRKTHVITRGAQQPTAATFKSASARYDSSPISRFNAADGGRTLTPPEEVVAVLALAQRFHERTHGAFDITARPLIELWRRAADQGHLPTDSALRRARAASTWEQIHIGPAGLVKDRGSTRVDIDGIAKGWAIDRALERLQRSGAAGGLVEVGGDLRLYGTGPTGGSWRVAIRSPFADESWAEIELAAGEAIIRKGEVGVAVYFILAGEVEVSLPAADGRNLATVDDVRAVAPMALRQRRSEFMTTFFERQQEEARQSVRRESRTWRALRPFRGHRTI